MVPHEDAKVSKFKWRAMVERKISAGALRPVKFDLPKGAGTVKLSSSSHSR